MTGKDAPTATPRTAPLLTAPFRPFFLLAALYGPLALFLFAAVHTGTLAAGFTGSDETLWHGHEMTFGFAAAIVAGFVMTALPTWAATPQIEGPRLALLALIWFLGRVSCWFAPDLAGTWRAAPDLAFFPLLLLLLLPGLVRAPRKRFLALAPVLAWLFAANLAFHLAMNAGAPEIARRALHAGIYGYMVLFGLVGGALTPIFTESALARSRPEIRITFNPVIEYLSIATIVAFAVTGMAWPGSPLAATAALAAAATNLLRMARWRSFAATADPLLAAMHLAFLWYIAAIAFRGLADLGLGPGFSAALHMFTVGALLLMKISLMTRIALRHTGRPLAPHPFLLAFFLVAGSAPVLRLLSLGGSRAFLLASVIAWASPFLAYLAIHGRHLIRPSLPRAPHAPPSERDTVA